MGVFTDVIGRMMLIDTSKCIACRACQIACQQWHRLPAEDTQFTGSYQNPSDLSVANLSLTRFTEFAPCGTDCSELRWLFFKDQCRHCDTPYCKQACPLRAIRRLRNGTVFIKATCDPDACSTDTVKPCQLACPYKSDSYPPVGLPRYRKNNGDRLPDGRANKCDFCYDRTYNAILRGDSDPFPPPTGLPAPHINGGRYRGKFARSHRTACELACPTGAIVTGSAAAIKKKTTRRYRQLKNIFGYPNACVYPSLPSHVVWLLTEDPSAYNVQEITP